ncbi:hypothetical protein QTP86_011678 [Hemibagrus guttatus]|nr:hypothetical protein QTP86_011678 [Hemibagrus guttatus]
MPKPPQLSPFDVEEQRLYSKLLPVDETTDITDVAQLAIFIRGVDDTLTVTEEFVELVPMTDTTTADDIFTALVGVLDRVGVDWSRAVSLAEMVRLQ